MRILSTILLVLSLFGAKTLLAASSFEDPKHQEIIVYSGYVVDGKSGEPVDFANVSLYDKTGNKLIAGTTTDNGGRFDLEVDQTAVILEISFVGYTTKRVSEYELLGGKASFGEIKIFEEGELLNEVVVVAERSTTEFKTDRRVFNVGTDLTSSGASALEVLNNVPSVNVDIEGAVTLRGSGGVQILINGKPSVLADEESGALGNITADMIEKVEVITNPSAKYEAEGTSGIINIILKRNKKKALNGSVTVNVGTPENNSIGLSMNKRTEKFNLFTQLGVGQKDRISDRVTRVTDFISGEQINGVGTEARNEGYYNIVLGSDYYIDSLNTITLTGNFTFEDEDQPSFYDFSSSLDDEILTQWTRSEVTTAGNPKWQYELNYKKMFRDNEDHNLVFSAIGNFFGKKQTSAFTEQLIIGTEDDVTDQLTDTDFNESKYTFNLDYTKPFGKYFTLEAGAQYVDNKVGNEFEVQNFEDGVYVTDENLTNFFEWNQKVLGVYSTGAYEGEVWGVKLGLRAERTDLQTLLVNDNTANSQKFLDFFPSAHTSYKVNERISLQAGYSRRIYRPRLWDLNPFFNIRNTFSVRRGNPDLRPEYTDSYEVGSVFIFDKISFNVNVYRRFTTEKIERVSIVEDNVTITAPLNIGTSATNGLEMNFKLTPLKKLTINGDMNYNLFTRVGEFEGESFDFTNDQYSVKINTRVKLNKQFEFEVSGRYESELQTVTSLRSPSYNIDFGSRYKILNGKIVFNLSVRDIFETRIRESLTITDSFESYSFSQLGRFITFGVSYGFGKGEAMTYSGGGRRR